MNSVGCCARYPAYIITVIKYIAQIQQKYTNKYEQKQNLACKNYKQYKKNRFSIYEQLKITMEVFTKIAQAEYYRNIK